MMSANQTTRLAASGAVAALWLAACPAARAAEQRCSVRLHTTATVTADHVRLSDVATVSGQGSEMAADWVITASPEPGSTRAVNASQIQRAMRDRGANLADWLVVGSTTCTITRPTVEKPAVAAPASRPAVIGFAPLTAVSPVAPIKTLRDAVNAHVAAGLAELGGTHAVRFSPSQDRLLALSRPTYDFRIVSLGERRLGLLSLEATILERGVATRTESLLVEVSLTRPVVVAAGAINKGQTITEQDVLLMPRRIDRMEDAGIGELNRVIGQRAKACLVKGERLATETIEPVPLVCRNDLVTVVARRGGIEIRSAAKAMGTAGLGTQIELRNELSKQTFIGLVTGLRTAELVESPGGPVETALAQGVRK